jgi:hypothetical protein
MQSDAWHGLADLDGAALTARLLGNLDALFEGGHETAEHEDSKLATLPEPLQVLWYLDWLDFEVSQGSLLAYFMNSHGRHAEAVVNALRRIGAVRIADVVGQAHVEAQRNANAWSRRRAELDERGQHAVLNPYRELAGADQLDALTDRYWEAADADNRGEKLERYLASEVDTITLWAAAP